MFKNLFTLLVSYNIRFTGIVHGLHNYTHTYSVFVAFIKKKVATCHLTHLDVIKTFFLTLFSCWGTFHIGCINSIYCLTNFTTMLGKKNMLLCTYSGAKCKSQYVGVLWTALRALASFSFFF